MDIFERLEGFIFGLAFGAIVGFFYGGHIATKECERQHELQKIAVSEIKANQQEIEKVITLSHAKATEALKHETYKNDISPGSVLPFEFVRMYNDSAGYPMPAAATGSYTRSVNAAAAGDIAAENNRDCRQLDLDYQALLEFYKKVSTK